MKTFALHTKNCIFLLNILLNISQCSANSYENSAFIASQKYIPTRFEHSSIPSVIKRNHCWSKVQCDFSLQKRTPNLKSSNIDNQEDLIGNSQKDSKLFSLDNIKASLGIKEYAKPPPMQIEDTSLLLYDIFLILNLTVSISFWVVHRMSFTDILPAFSEGSLMCILWVMSGLWNGAFLYSAADGHYGSEDEKGGPTSAALLGLSTFVGVANMRILVALGTAILEHRQVGMANGEEFIPLEIAFGLMLMSCWRALHSSYSRQI